ncbi:dihydrolipoamide acetyltransferase family protein [Microbacterium sp. NPDC089695]|uniref:dihydrolipoamide acetyltransferase family protein n=1 Tax=Microbacterium sp. NPDC089695 TaxID=3364198 RepID=UPI00381F6F16
MTALTARVFRLPDLGEGLTEAGLVQWLVAVGDTIATDQPIAEVETAKSIVELPSPYAGVVTALHGAPGDTIDVGAPVLEVSEAAGTAGGGITADAADAANDPDAAKPVDAVGTADAGTVEHEAYRAEERAGSGNVLIGYGTSARTGSGRRRPPRNVARTEQTRAELTPAEPSQAEQNPAGPGPAEPSQADHTPAVPGSAEPSPAEQSSAAAAQPAARPIAVRSPLVRRLARDLGLDVRTITPTGHDGAITRADVIAAAVDSAVDGVRTHSDEVGARTGGDAPGADARMTTTDTTTPDTTGTIDKSDAATIDGLAVRSRERLSPLRKAVSAKLSRSRSEIPEATVWVDVDATELWELRRRMAPPEGRAPSITALVARFVLIALSEHPVLASRLSDDATELVSFDGVNLGVAVDTDRGLLVPVMPHADALSVDALDAGLRELSTTARSGSMPPERLRGSTFTLNNYGGLGVDGSAAIINHPDVAILGIGRMIERPWVVDGEIVARRIAQLSLVFDHRVCDGGYAASFLKRVTDLIEHPLRAFGRI